ncbi:hypothetical protein P7C73_g6331, partial [Tremellales sp. Uapishka_1]
MTTPSTSASSATLYTPTETAPLLSSASKLPHEIERIHDEEGDTAREVEVYEPGRSGFAETTEDPDSDYRKGPRDAVVYRRRGLRIGGQGCGMGYSHLLDRNHDLAGHTRRPLFRFHQRSMADLFQRSVETHRFSCVRPALQSDVCAHPTHLTGSIIPTAYLPLHIISYSSAIGVASTWGLIGILLFSGIVTPTTPGSIRDPAPTDLWPAHGAVKFLTCFGLFLSGFGGHAMIPTLIRDMKKPKQADRIVEIAYGIAMTVYLVIAICGYIMYGTNVSDEISKDLARTPGVTPLMNKLAVWTVAINPLTKIALAIKPVSPLLNSPSFYSRTRQLSDIIYSYFNLHPTMLVPLEPAEPSVEQLMALETVHLQKERSKRVVRNIVKLAIAVLAVAGALIIRSFESMMGVMGSGFGGLLCIVIPVWAGCSVFGWTWWRKAIILLGAVFAAIGVVASAWPETRVEPY